MTEYYQRCSRRGIAMIEATIATLLVSTVIASTLGVVGPVVRSTQLAENQIVAQRLADELLEEIAAMPFDDPELIAAAELKGWEGDLNDFKALSLLGPDSGERTGVRTDFDDVDDYEGWISSPPSDTSGAYYSNLTRSGRQVFVDHVSTKDFTTPSASRTGAKLIRVLVYHNSLLLAEESIIRTESWDSMRGTP
jgi:type II secretory pathway pseudopilin PulG